MVQSSARAPAGPAASERRAQRSRCCRGGAGGEPGGGHGGSQQPPDPVLQPLELRQVGRPPAGWARGALCVALRGRPPLRPPRREEQSSRGARPPALRPPAAPGPSSVRLVGAGSGGYAKPEQSEGVLTPTGQSRRRRAPGPTSCLPTSHPASIPARLPCGVHPRRNRTRERGGAAGRAAPRGGARRGPGAVGEDCRPAGAPQLAAGDLRVAAGWAERKGGPGRAVSGRPQCCQAPRPPRGHPERLRAWAAGSRAPHAPVLPGRIILPGEMRKMRTTE